MINGDLLRTTVKIHATHTHSLSDLFFEEIQNTLEGIFNNNCRGLPRLTHETLVDDGS